MYKYITMISNKIQR